MNFKHFIFFLTFIFTSAYGDEDLSLRDIYVITDVITPGDISSGQTLSSSKLNTQFQRDTASLLETFTGIHSANNGSVSSIPYMHGFNDDRIRISVDGVDLNSACTSHSDTDLSFVNIDDVDFVKVFAGITPVSMGGDSIAGTIKIKTKKPKFNSTQEWSESANIKSFYDGNINKTEDTLSEDTSTDTKVKTTETTIQDNKIPEKKSTIKFKVVTQDGKSGITANGKFRSWEELENANLISKLDDVTKLEYDKWKASTSKSNKSTIPLFNQETKPDIVTPKVKEFMSSVKEKEGDFGTGA